jgi:cytochrome c biogenesis protein
VGQAAGGQRSRRPLVLGAIAFAVAGLCLSLFVRPRRVWVRFSPGADGRRLLEVAGFDRADARTGLSEDVQHLLTELSGGENAPPPDPKDASQ